MSALTPSAEGLFDGPRRAWRWWCAELAGMIPRRLRGGLHREDRYVDLWIAPDETRIERVADGVGERLVDPRPLAALDEAAWEQLAELVGDQQLRIILLAPATYTTCLTLPRQVGSRVRQVVALQLGEVAPVRPERLRWNIAPPRMAADKIEVDVVMARADRVDAIVAELAAHGLPSPQVLGEVDGNLVLLEAAIQEPLGLFRRPSSWLIALALLASIPITTLFAANLFIWADNSAVTALEPQAQERMRQDRRARATEQVRQAVALVARQIAVSQILDDLAEALPPDAFLVEAERDPQGRLKLVVDAADPDAVRQVLERNALFRFDQVNEMPAEDDRMRMTFQGRPR